MRTILLFAIAFFLTCSPALAQDKKKQSRVDVLAAEVKALRAEIAELRELIRSISGKPVQPTQPATRKVWKQVRPSIQIEGMIDDGYELVEVPIETKQGKQ